MAKEKNEETAFDNDGGQGNIGTKVSELAENNPAGTDKSAPEGAATPSENDTEAAPPTLSTGAQLANIGKEEAEKTIQYVAGMVARYTKGLVNSKRAEQFMTTFAMMVNDKPELAQADKASLVTSLMACVKLDLMPNTPEQHAYLIAYKNHKSGKLELQFQIGYKGLLVLARRSGMIKTINAELVFQGDEFEVDFGTERRLVHRPNFEIDRDDYSKVTHGYVVTKLVNGESDFQVMTKGQIDKIRDEALSKAYDRTNKTLPWNKWPTEQAKKTVLKRATKTLPSSTEDQSQLTLAAQLDSMASAGRLMITEGGQFAQKEESEEESRADMRHRIDAAAGEASEIDDPNFKPKNVKTPEAK